MKTVNTFRVVFFGETLDTCNVADVREKMGQILKIAPKEIQALLSGQNSIVKDRLDLVSTAGYHRMLKRAGIITRVQPMAECPFCGHRQCLSDTCKRCGAPRPPAPSALCFLNGNAGNAAGTPRSQKAAPPPISKTPSGRGPEASSTAPEQKPEQKAHTSPAERDGLAEETPPEDKKIDNPTKLKAHGRLRTAIMLLTSVVFLDSQLQDFMTLDLQWLYLIPLPFFILGCLHLARLKGYAGGWGMLGASTLFGMGFLLLLPDRIRPGKRELKGTLFALTLLIIAVFWAGEKISTWHDLRSLSQTAASREDAWRSFGPDMANYHLMGLRSFMDQAFQTAEEHELRPREKYRIAEMCMDGLGRLLFGIQNYRFKEAGKEGELPVFDDKLLSLWKYDFIEYLHLKALDLDDPYFLNCSNNWHFIKNYRGEFFAEKDINFIVNLHAFEKIFNKTIFRFEKENGRLPGRQEDLAQFLDKNNFSSGSKIRFDSPKKLTLTFGAGAGELEGETIQFGMAEGEKIHSSKKLVRIGGTLSERYRPGYSDYYVLKTMRSMEEYKSSDLLSQIKWFLMRILGGF